MAHAALYTAIGSTSSGPVDVDQSKYGHLSAATIDNRRRNASAGTSIARRRSMGRFRCISARRGGGSRLCTERVLFHIPHDVDIELLCMSHTPERVLCGEATSRSA